MKSLDKYWDSINVISIILLPLSALFYVISLLRKLAYKTGIMFSYQSPVPVIVIGNISVGGTGKTPLIIELVKQLQQRGKKPAVISRGYGGQSSSWPQLVTSETQAQQVGDEPQLIFQHTQCPIAVGPNRKDDIELLLSQFNCDVILSDDGLQHYALQRDIEICVVDANKQFGNEFYIPAGPLRESKARLKSVDLVLYNGAFKSSDSFEMQAADCVFMGSTDTPENVSLASFSGKTVHAIAGIGNPQRFFSMLEKNNIKIISHAFKDHHHYQISDLVFDDNLDVMMTEKDAIKCSGLDLKNHWSVPVKIVFGESAQKKLDKIFNSII